MKRLCCECGKKRERCREVVQHVYGTVDVVCPRCCKDLDYAEFMNRPPSAQGPKTW